MSNNVIKNIHFKLTLFLYVGLEIIFYPVSRMYAEEYVTRPIQLEFALFMAFVAFLSNIGIFLIVFEKAMKLKKLLCLSIIISVFMNVFLLLITNGNPLSLVTNEYWDSFRYVSAYIILGLGIVLSILVGKYQNETR